jgi:hypothetical protein
MEPNKIHELRREDERAQRSGGRNFFGCERNAEMANEHKSAPLK